MPDLTIKPVAAAGNKLILQDQAGGAVLTTADSGATAANVTLASTTTFPAGNVIWVNSVHKGDVASITTPITGTIQDMPDMTLTTPVPASSSSKYLVMANLAFGMNGDQTHIYTWLHRSISGGASGIVTGANADADGGSRTEAWGVSNAMFLGEQAITALQYLDSPSSTTAITYKLQWISGNTGPAYLNRSYRDSNSAANDGRATSSFTIMEIAG